MGDMKSDIDKYAKIWDSALEQGIFDDAPKPPKPSMPEADADYFGQYQINDDIPLNEVDVQYWEKVSRIAGNTGKYVDPLVEEVSTKKDIENISKAVASAHNPIMPQSVGKDQDVNVTQNWGVGGKGIEQLEELKVRLEKLESKLNSLEGNGESGKSTQTKIDELKKQIDDLSDTIAGDRFEPC